MRLTLLRAIWALALSAALLSPAKIEDWQDPQGNVFKAEPAEALGPFALFRTPTGGGRRLPWRALSHADCARFEAQAGTQPAPAARWADANGGITGRLRGYLRTFQDVNAVTADLDVIPEPELLIVLYVEASASGSWDMVNQSIPLYQVLRQKYAGELAAVQYGVNHTMQDHSDMILRTKAPWLMVEHSEQQRIAPLFRLSPRRGEFALYALSRDGVPVFGTNNPDEAAVTQFFADANALLALLRPDNPHSWADRAHYLAGLQLARHQQDSAGPVLVGNPLVARTLRNLSERGITRVEATIEVGADGKATAVTLKEDPAISAKLASDLAKALQQFSVFAPAVDKGQFVTGTYHYLVETQP